MVVFELAEVSKVTSIPKTRVQNWSVGRPLRITPSIRGGRGQGSRNLYSKADVYRMALAKELTVYLDTNVIQNVIDEAYDKLNPYNPGQDLRWLVIELEEEGKVKPDWLGPYDDLRQKCLADYTGDKKMSFALYIINLSKLFTHIDSEIEALGDKP